MGYHKRWWYTESRTVLYLVRDFVQWLRWYIHSHMLKLFMIKRIYPTNRTEHTISILIKIFQDEHKIKIDESEKMKTIKYEDGYNIVFRDRIEDIDLERMNQV